MYAIVDIAGQQFKVQKDQKIFVHRLEGEEGSQVEFSQVLLVDDNGKVSVGTPEVEGASVTAKIIAHLKGDKVLVFKKKRRKGYQKMNGHRQFFSEITVESINTGGKKKAEKSPQAEKAPEAPAVEVNPAQEEN
jgi:large subunit ribosomal protein L21